MQSTMPWVPTWDKDPALYHQGALLGLALEEKGINASVRIDHINGRGRYGATEVGIVYPDSWFVRTKAFVPRPKPVRFLFIGYAPRHRLRLLRSFQQRHPEAVVSATTKRTKHWKGEWDEGYFARLGAAQLGLCPHHPNWGGPWKTLWTYRFIECCMVGAIPVLFRVTPLGKAFTEGIRYVWDDDDSFTYSVEDALHNRAVAEQKWSLP
jgi:hypothetical protein